MSNFPWFMDLTFKVFTALYFTFITTHIHNWALYLLWSRHFIHSGVIGNSPLVFPSSILDTFRPGGLIFWCHIFFAFYTIHEVLMASILKWFAIPSINESCFFVRILCRDPSVLDDSARHGSQTHWVMQVLSAQQVHEVIHVGITKALMALNCGAGKTLKSPLDSKETKPVHLKGGQPWIFTGRTVAEAEAPVFWSSYVNTRLIGKVPDAGKDWGQKEKRASEDEMTGWYNQCNEHELGQTPRDN